MANSEAEETLRAIQRGEVDAVVVEGDAVGPRVFTLSSALHPYQVIVERMFEGAAAIDGAGTVLYSNRRFSDLAGADHGSLIGRSFLPLVCEADRPRAARLLVDGLEYPAAIQVELAGGPPVMLSAAPVELDWKRCLALIVTDLSPRQRSDRVAVAERFAFSILDQATEAMIVCDIAGYVTHANLVAQSLAKMSPVGKPAFEAFGFQSRDRANLGVLLDQSAGGQSVEFELPAEGCEPRQFLGSGGPLRDAHAAVVGFVLTFTEITQRKREERRQALLVGELDHRVKNTLAVVMAMATQTLASATSLDEFGAAFTGRVQALANANGLLTLSHWGSIEIGTLLRQALAPFAAEDRIRLTGPGVPLGPKAAVSLAMMFHELATNAAKHGSLSVEAGRVAVDWFTDPRNDRLTIRWRECGGPKLTGAPARRGFGSRLLQLGVP
ncbi:MAG: PAS domain-containing protein, partial [Alphaproteobacteria bacterium]|nr:PAS domain-containing protein [Alphaproteobacteria bacterium]